MSSARTDVGWRALTGSLAFRIGALQLALFVATFALLIAAADHATSAAIERVQRQRLREELAEQWRHPAEPAPTREASFVAGDAPRAPRSDGWIGAARVEPDGAFGSTRPLEASLAFGRRDVPARGVAPLSDARRVALGADRLVSTELLSSAWREATLAELRESYAWILGSVALVGLLGGLLLTRRALRPVRELAATAQRVVREGDLAARVPLRHSGDELDRLAACFNHMLAHNERLVRGMRDALDHVAHDLRTPLTRLRATAELSLREGTPEAQREALADVVEESDRVLSTLRTLTDISEAESGAMRLERRPVELAAVIREVIDLYEHVAEEAGVALRAELGHPVVVSADRVRIAQAVANLVDNAIKYTRQGGEVVVSARREGERAVLAVRDTGIGIPDEARPRIWERLYRADPSRSQRGLGLGLSFVRAIVLAHGGEARVSSAPGRGSLFELWLPV